jgi:hypothetical protein
MADHQVELSVGKSICEVNLMLHQAFDELDTNQGVVSQIEFKKIYRAKHAKLAKAPPTPRF